MHRLFALLSLVLIAAWTLGCTETATVPPETETLEIQVTLTDPVVVAGGSLFMDVTGAGLLVPDRAEVRLVGSINARAIDRTLVASFKQASDDVLRLEVPWGGLEPLLSSAVEARFIGDLSVVIHDVSGRIQGRGTSPEGDIQLVRSLTPNVSLSTDGERIFLNEDRLHPTSGILRKGEGRTMLLLEGEFEANNGDRRMLEVAVEVEALEDRERNEARIVWSASLFGIRPGVFQGRATAFNEHAFGEEVVGTPQDITVEVLPTVLEGFDPPGASRGGRIQALGKGFIPLNPDRAQSMFFELEGTFRAFDGEVVELIGDRVLRLAPDDVPSHNAANVVMRSEVMDLGQRKILVGLTARPGTFTGTITPVLVDIDGAVNGVPYQGTFGVLPTRQKVFVKFLPGFSDALAFYGLRNVEPEIRARIFAVMERDYEGINIGFIDERPTDFAEYSVIEVGGRDPNGVGLLGLDNTAGKDVGNVRLDDVIGGQNAESGELGFYVFGGVFIESFTLFSPSLTPTNDLTSAAFDVVFGPFMPDLGGTPVQAGELNGGARQELVEQAVLGIGNLIGNTISHEIGHSLGLSFFEEDLERPTEQFHNEFDEPGAMMDAGRDRPFEERMELLGRPPSKFNDRNRQYLEGILPMP